MVHRLPTHIKTILAGQAEDRLDAASQMADRIAEVAALPTTASIAQAPEAAGLHQKIEDLYRQVAALTSGRTLQRSHSRDARRKTSPSSLRPRGARLLWVPPAIRGQCAKLYTTVLLPQAGKRQRQALMAANACSASSGRLFTTDRVRKLRFLIDTGSDVCVAPRSFAPGRRSESATIFSQSKVHP